MDGRRSLVLGLCVLTGSLGCAALPQRAPGDPAAETHPEKEQAKRAPLPSSCVAYGNLYSQLAADPNCSAMNRQEFQEKARLAYQQALEISPSDQAALTQLGWLYVAMDDHDHAVASLQRAVQSHAEDANAWYQLGVCQARYHEWVPALDNLRRAVEIDPENRTASHFYGYTLAHAGKYDESFMVFAKLEGDANAHFELARMLHHMQQDGLCKSHLQKALQLNPRLTPARELLATLAGTGPTAPAAKGLEPAPVSGS